MSSGAARSLQRPSITIREVAKLAGVSTATVSRVLNQNNGANPLVRDRVLAAVRQLDYHPNRLASGLRARQRKLIGVVLPDLQNPFFTGVAHGVEDVFWQEGYTLLLGHSNGQPERELAHLALLRAEGAAGLVLIPGDPTGTDYASLRAWSVPVVAVDRQPAGVSVDLVKTTNHDGALEATQHLLRLGYRDLGMLNGPESFEVSRERLAGFLQALAAAGLPARPEFIVHGDFRQAGGYAAMQRLLRLPAPPRAVLIANNLMTLGALQAIHERALRIPEDLGVIGFDDMPWATSLRPPLTAVAQPANDLGRAAAQLLLERLRDPDRPVRQVTLPTRLVVRASCGAPATRSWNQPENLSSLSAP